jgi:mRNA interferase MazF
MNNLRRGMVIDVDLNPTVGSETGKKRPCIIVSNDDYNSNPNLPIFQVVPITEWSRKKEKILTNVSIKPNSNNGLTKKSVADCLQTRPIDVHHRFAGIRGNLSAEVMDEIDQALKVLFELD